MRKAISKCVVTGLSILLFALPLLADSKKKQAPPKNKPKQPRTLLTGDLDTPIPASQNLVWCATLQLMWNRMVGDAGGPLRLDNPVPLAAKLNKPAYRFPSDEKNVFTASGLVGNDLLTRLQAQAKQKFPRNTPKVELPGNLSPGDYFAYSLLFWQFEYPVAFKRTAPSRFYSADKLDSPKTKVNYFGFSQFLGTEDAYMRKLGKQVHVIWHEFKKTSKEYRKKYHVLYKQHFIIELDVKSKDYRLILAKIPPAKTLHQTMHFVQSRLKKPNRLTEKDFQKW